MKRVEIINNIEYLLKKDEIFLTSYLKKPNANANVVNDVNKRRKILCDFFNYIDDFNNIDDFLKIAGLIKELKNKSPETKTVIVWINCEQYPDDTPFEVFINNCEL